MTHHLPIIGDPKNKAVLTKAQKEFNRLINKISTLQEEAKAYETMYVTCQKRIAEELHPLLQEYNGYRIQLVELLDRSYDNRKMMARERKKLQEIILDMSHDLISNKGVEQLKPIYNKHSKSDYDEDEAEVDEQASIIMRNFVEQLMGISIPKDVDVSTPEKMDAYLHRRMAEEQEAIKEHQRKIQEKRAQKPKSAKQLEQEKKRAEKQQKKAEEEAKVTKSVREVYLDLVKTFHPDRETDTSERQRKTEIMQRVTDAYERNDLLALLQLQLEFERIDQDHLENLAEDRLIHFNKVLRAQTKELEDLLWGRKMEISDMLNLAPYAVNSAYQLQVALEKDLKGIKRAIKEIKNDLRDYQDIEVVNLWLKSLKKTPKNRRDDDDFYHIFMP